MADPQNATRIGGFVLVDKSGTRMTFGRTSATPANDGYQVGGLNGVPDALAYEWALKRVEDVLGNTIDLAYHENPAGGEYAIARITYTGNSANPSIQPLADVRFHYDLNVVVDPNQPPGDPPATISRRDKTSRFVAERRFRSTMRLDKIVASFSSGTALPTFAVYDLSYDYAPNFGPTRLVMVQASLREMADPAANLLKAASPTRITWSGAPFNPSSPTPIYSTTPDAVIPTGSTDIPESWGFGDVDGDGKDDLIDARSGQFIHVRLSNGTSFGPPIAWTAPGLWTGPKSIMKICDINGDGRKDIIYSGSGPFPNAVKTGSKLYAMVSDGSRFIPLDGGTTPFPVFTFADEFRDPNLGTFEFATREEHGVTNRICTADFTGDGRDDILIHRYDGRLRLLKSTGSAFTTVGTYDVGAEPLQGLHDWESFSLRYLGFIEIEHFSVSMMPCDLNGDGLTDYAWIQSSQSLGTRSSGATSGVNYARGAKTLWAVTTQPGGGFSQRSLGPQWSWTYDAQSKGDHRINSFMVIPGDVNGDGLTDFLTITPGQVLDAAIDDNGTVWSGVKQRVLHHLVTLSKGASGSPQFESIPDPIPQWVSVNGQQVRPWFDKIRVGQWINDRYWDLAMPDPAQRSLLFATGFFSSGDNITLADINHDGLQDYVWYVTRSGCEGWWVMYSLGNGFSAPQKVPLGWAPTQQLQSGASDMYLNSRSGLDLNGDGIQDYAYANASCAAKPGIDGFHLGLAGQPGTRVIAVTNGLNSSTSIAYVPITSDAVYTPGARDIPGTPAVEGVQYPIRELRNATYVVSDVFKDSGAATPAHFSYQYSGNRLDLSGRGSLGFHSFVTLDRQTNLFKYQFLVQSFPMTGLTHREQTYRYWETGPNVNFRLISSHDNTVVFDEVVSTGGGAYGTVYPFMSQAVESRWEDSTTRHFPEPGQPEWTRTGSPESKPELLFPKTLPTGAHITINARSWFDNQDLALDPQTTFRTGVPFNPSDFKATNPEASRNAVVGVDHFPTYLTSALMPRKITHGNLRQLQTDFGEGFTEKVVTTYLPPTTNGLTGRVDKVETTVTSPVGGTEFAPTRSLTYWTNGSTPTPLVASERLDADRNGQFTDQLDLVTTHTRDSLGRITATAISGFNSPGHPRDIGTNIVVQRVDAHDARFDLPTATRNADPYNHLASTTYHPLLGQPASVTGPNNDTVTTEYDALGRVTRTTDVLKGLATRTSFAWTTAGATDWTRTQTVTAPAGVPGALTLSSVYAVRTWVTPAGSTTACQPPVTAYFDRLGRTIRTIKEGYAGQKAVTDTIYNTLGQAVAVSLPYKTGDTPLWTRTTYDPFGRVATVTAPNGTLTTNTYIGRATKVTVDAPLLGGIDPAPQTNVTLVDAKGRTVKVWNADNVPATITTTGSGMPEASIEYRLDGFGRMRETILKGQIQRISATYDPHGRQESLNDPDKGLWQYTNNALGQVVEQTDARGNHTRTFFDRLGRQLTRITREPSNGPVETAQWFYYDTVTDTALHRVAQGEVAFGSRTVKGWIGALQREESATLGAPGYAASPAITTRYYDQLGRPAVDVATTDGRWFHTYTAYDSLSRVSQVLHHWREPPNENPATLPSEWKDWGYTYTYDSLGYVTSMADTHPQGARTWWQAHATEGYDHLDRPVKVRKGAGHWTTRTYRTTDGVLTAIKTGATLGAAQIQNLTFDFDALGNLTSRTINVGAMNGLTAINRTETFGYDILNRLTTRNGASIATYAANGNLTNKQDVTGAWSPTAYAYSATRPHAVTSAWGFDMGYDASGNLLSRVRQSGGTVLEKWETRWAGFDKPRWLARDTTGEDFQNGTFGSEFHYNAARRRVIHLEFDSMTGSSGNRVPSHYTRKRLYALGSTVEVDYKNLAASGTPNWSFDRIRIYIPGPEGTIGVREYKPGTAVETPRVYHYDHLGSIECITPYGSTATTGSVLSLDDNGKPARYSYDPWGERRNPVTWSGKPLASSTDNGGPDGATPRGFTGHEMLDDLGLVHMNGRIYDGLLGRMLSADVFVQNESDLQSYNRYSYVRNRPLSAVDPSGFLDEPAILQYLSLTAEGKQILNDLEQNKVTVIEYSSFKQYVPVTEFDGSGNVVKPEYDDVRVWDKDGSRSTLTGNTVKGTITSDAEVILIKEGLPTEEAAKFLRDEWGHLQQRKTDPTAFDANKIRASEVANSVATETFVDSTNSAIATLRQNYRQKTGPKVNLSMLPKDSRYRDRTGAPSAPAATAANKADSSRQATQTKKNVKASIFNKNRIVQTGNNRIPAADVTGKKPNWNFPDLERWLKKMGLTR